MIARLVTMLAILAIAVMTTASYAHSARMGLRSSVDHATYVVEIVHAPDIAERACDAGQHCGSTDAEMCEFACAGLSTLLTSPGGEAGHVDTRASHDLASEAIHVSRTPGLNERPPNLVLL